MIENNEFEGTKKVIDVSATDPTMRGASSTKVRDEVVARGIIINGLPIMTEADKFDVYYLADLDKYYEGCVVGGPGSFIQVAHGFADLARALRRKLVLEIRTPAKRQRIRFSSGLPSRNGRALERILSTKKAATSASGCVTAASVRLTAARQQLRAFPQR